MATCEKVVSVCVCVKNGTRAQPVFPKSLIRPFISLTALFCRTFFGSLYISTFLLICHLYFGVFFVFLI